MKVILGVVMTYLALALTPVGVELLLTASVHYWSIPSVIVLWICLMCVLAGYGMKFIMEGIK